ncbi:MAG: HAD-IA family hydrolase [Bryobacteraceae bacterium]
MSLPYLVFDMDGVLAEVSESYREAIVQTVRHFTAQTVAPDRIQEYKNRGGFNNDWLLSQQICRDFGVEVSYGRVVEYFCAIFFGPHGDDGLIARELWLPRPNLLESLAANYHLAIFTGRLQHEAAITLRRYASGIGFSPIIAAEDVRDGKPAPEGLLSIRDRTRCREMIYVGDTVDDARCSRAAGVPFIGIAAPSNPLHSQLAALLRAEGAVAVLDDVNQIEGALAACAAPPSNA